MLHSILEPTKEAIFYLRVGIEKCNKDQMKTRLTFRYFRGAMTMFPCLETPFSASKSSKQSSLSVLVDLLLIDFLLCILAARVCSWLFSSLSILFLVFSAFFRDLSSILWASSLLVIRACCIFLSTCYFLATRCPFLPLRRDYIECLLRKWCIRFWYKKHLSLPWRS